MSQLVVGPGATNYTTSGTLKGLPEFQQPEESHEAQKRHTVANTTTPSSAPRIFVAGSLAVDLSCDYIGTSASAKEPALYTSNPATIAQSLGGVAHNVARAAHLVGGSVQLCSAVGNDLMGNAALEALKSEGIQIDGVAYRDGARTAQYVAVNDARKDLFVAIADMGILEDRGTSDSVDGKDASIKQIFDDVWIAQLQAAKPSHIVLDANWQPKMLAHWLKAAKDLSAHVSFEPVSNAKSARLFNLPSSSPLTAFPNHLVDLISPNSYELSAMYVAARSHSLFDRQDWWEVIDAIGIPSSGARIQLSMATTPALVDAGVPQQCIQLLPFVPCVVTKLGAAGVLVAQLLRAGDPRLTNGQYAPHILSRCTNNTEESLGVGGVYMRLFPAAERVDEDEIVSVNGVGDTFLGALVAGMEKNGIDARVEDLVDLAQRAAVMTLKSKEAVSPELRKLQALL